MIAQTTTQRYTDRTTKTLCGFRPVSHADFFVPATNRRAVHNGQVEKPIYLNKARHHSVVVETCPPSSVWATTKRYGGHMSALTIGSSAIRQINGLYSLNDLHKASGNLPKHQPALFIRLDQTQALIAEINSTDMQSLETREGRNGGTYACKELVIAYAAWISPAFHLKVIRVFLAQAGRTLPDTISKAQQGELATLIAERFPSVPVLSIAISEAMRHTVLGFDSPKAQGAKRQQSDGAFSMRDASSMGEADGASSDAPVPCARSVNLSVSPTRLTAGSEFYNLHKETIMQTDAGMLQPVRLEINGLSFRIFNINNRPWFAATDVCESLGLANSRKAIANLRECERCNLKLQRGGSLNLINESGLYTLILRCDAAIKEGTDAFKFRVKVTDEILPSLREHGFYAVQDRAISKAQQGELATLIAERFPSGKDRPYAWSRFNNHFRLASYKDLPASRFGEACKYIKQMPELAPALPASYNYPLESARPKRTIGRTAWMTVDVLLDERNPAPEFALLEALEKAGYDVNGARIRIESLHYQVIEYRKFRNRLKGLCDDVSVDRGRNVNFLPCGGAK